eukprot:GDKI01018498.1.p1 GENE.GDKI01018498.1~~GDKI01018498.1.p1  ORF type:complete len:101 (+),score=42.21 GDKI01018498.1:1-303(+)
MIDLALANLEEKYRHHPGGVPLDELEERLVEAKEEMGISMKKFSDVVKNKGVCLKNCRKYGSISDLRIELRMEKKLIVSKYAAKEFKHVKQCLIFLGWRF